MSACSDKTGRCYPLQQPNVVADRHLYFFPAQTGLQGRSWSYQARWTVFSLTLESSCDSHMKLLIVLIQLIRTLYIARWFPKAFQGILMNSFSRAIFYDFF